MGREDFPLLLRNNFVCEVFVARKNQTWKYVRVILRGIFIYFRVYGSNHHLRFPLFRVVHVELISGRVRDEMNASFARIERVVFFPHCVWIGCSPSPKKAVWIGCSPSPKMPPVRLTVV